MSWIVWTLGAVAVGGAVWLYVSSGENPVGEIRTGADGKIPFLANAKQL